jgi:hypothetical protein
VLEVCESLLEFWPTWSPLVRREVREARLEFWRGDLERRGGEGAGRGRFVRLLTKTNRNEAVG